MRYHRYLNLHGWTSLCKVLRSGMRETPLGGCIRVRFLGGLVIGLLSPRFKAGIGHCLYTLSKGCIMLCCYSTPEKTRGL
jgi:hypothetical protein